METTAIIAVIGIVLTACGFIIGQYAGAKKKGANEGTLLNNVEHITNSLDEIKGSLKTLKNQQHSLELTMERRTTVLEESAKQAHKRISEHVENHK